MYYTSATQIAALLPSSGPTTGPVSPSSPGAPTITVTYNGEASGPTPFQGVVFNGPGIFTINSTGTGPGIVTYPDYSLISPSKAANCGGPNTTCGAANPGDTLIIWATGLGPIPGNDASGAGLGQNMPSLLLTVWVGGMQAPVLYQGRSGCCIGEDQIVFTVPSNVPTGCAVLLVVQVFNAVSNSVVMPIANGSRTCTPSDPALRPLNLQQGVSQDSLSVGVLELDRTINNNPNNQGGTGFEDRARFTFLRASGIPSGLRPFLMSYLDQPPVGTCMAIGPSVTFTGSGSASDVFFSTLNLGPLDAGSGFRITGPNGSMSLNANPGSTSLLDVKGKFLTPGSYTITGGPGKDVGAFTAQVTIPVSPTLTSPASATNLTVVKSQGMTVSWNPNGSTEHVELVLASPLDPNTAAQVACTAPASAGSFTIPSYVLAALPGGFPYFLFQPGGVGPASSAMFSAPGLDVGIARTFIAGTYFNGFQLRGN